jgi:hypothetical protein
MNRVRFIRVQLAVFVCFVVAGALGLAGQAKPTNLFKEVEDHKAKIVWKNAPANTIPADVCTILQACAAGPDKLIAQPKVTEAGKQVTRMLFLSHTNDAKKADIVVVTRVTPTEAYFFAVGPDGELQKAAYWTTGKSWVQMGSALSKPTFEKDKQIWLDQIGKISAGAPAPAAAAAPQG